MSTSTADSCAPPGNRLLRVDEARQRILDAVRAIGAAEQLHIRAALNRVLAAPVVSTIDVPPFDNSAMDGYALRSSDCDTGGSTRLRVVGTCYAGAPFEGRIQAGECVRIMTGAPMPAGADVVIMQEQVARDGETVELSGTTPQAGEHVRRAGDDTRRGDPVLQAGVRLGPAEIGLLASVGVGEVSVVRRPRVAFFSTGDELRGLGAALAPGQIYDCNRYTLFALLTEAGLECHDLGVVADRREAVRAAFRQAGDVADLVLTSGGVSVGEADFVTETLEEMGEINFWRMAMKPGKPLAFGRLRQAYFFGLPGNPVSVIVTFYQFVLPAIRKMCGEPPRAPLLLQARAGETLGKAPGRAEFQRGILSRDDNGDWVVASTGAQESHLLSSMSRANCFVLLPAESAGAAEGELVSVQPFCDLA
jgi:molybdopterin molybdotransferase